ncbi:MAG: hypothetical protein WC889_16050 [Myxococcota bacterium]|jgi:hypothetical protein
MKAHAMGKLTEDVSKLHEEIIALRGARKSLMADLAAGADRLSSTVSDMRADFKARTAAVTGKARLERAAFTAGLKESVNAARTRTNSDLAGARKAWFGPSAAEKTAGRQAELRRIQATAAKMVEDDRRKAEAIETKRVEDERKKRESEHKRHLEEMRVKHEAEERKRLEEEQHRKLQAIHHKSSPDKRHPLDDSHPWTLRAKDEKNAKKGKK